MPKYSIIIPVYNDEKTINKCIDSILEQSYKDYELLIVDDCSNDDSYCICKEYKDKRIKLYHQEQNKGVSVARNKGLNNAKGEYVLFVDSDDFVEKNYLLEIDKYAGLYDLIEFGHFDYCVDNDNKQISTKPSSMNHNVSYDDDDSWHKLFMETFFASPWNKLYSRKLIGELRFDETCVCYEDYIFNLRYCSLINNFVVINNPLYNYRQNLNINHVTKRKWGEKFAVSDKVYLETKRFIEGCHIKDIEKYLYCYPYGAYMVELKASKSFNTYTEDELTLLKNNLFIETILKIEPKGKKIFLLYVSIKAKCYILSGIIIRLLME